MPKRTYPKVSIIVPVIRPDKAARCISFALENAGIPFENIRIVSEEDKERIGCPKMVKLLVGKAKTDLVCFLGDDTIPQPGWLRVALEKMEELPGGWGLVGLNDMAQDGELFATHWVASKKLLPFLDDEFFCTEYFHSKCDRELTDRCKEMGRYVWAETALIKHDHPFGSERDPNGEYAGIYAADKVRRDYLLYKRRTVERLSGDHMRLGIGFPLVSTEVETEFFISYAQMDMPMRYLYRPRFPVNDFLRDHAAVREDLVKQAMQDGITHLIMMDTDQVYPEDTVAKLLQHKDLDIVGAAVFRRWEPFDLIMYRGTLGKYKHVPDEECFSGELIEIDATGGGCFMVNMKVFYGLEPPWFKIIEGEDGKPVGEDIYFCSKARQAGYRIWIDTSIKIEHINKMAINEPFYKLFKKIKGFGWAPIEEAIEKVVAAREEEKEDE